MENNIITKEYFSNEHLSQVTMIKDSENVVWFKGFDIATILGYSNTRDALKKHVDEDEKKKMNEFQMMQNATPKNSQPHSIFINESGLFSLILRSN